MSMSKKWIIIGFVFGAVLFLLSPSFQNIISNPGFWNMKEQFLYLTGSVAMAYMVMSMVLSVRIGRINEIVGGLDKAYVVHKWVGIYAFVFIILHWVVKEGPKVLSALELVPPKVKSGAAAPYSDLGKVIFDFGNDIVEIAFYVLVAVLLISLLKKVPYHIFRLIHKIIPALFLVAAFHGVTIQIKGQWFGSVGSFMLCIIIAIGCIAAFVDLFQMIGKNNKVKAIISKLEHDKNGRIIDIRLSLSEGRFNYLTGQYVFLKFSSGEPHPFSIASFDKNMNSIRIIIKELGDFTNKLSDIAKEGDSVVIEGPYGSFTFEDDSNRQVWIAGGIGVTPFISRLEYIIENGGQNKPVDFFYSSRGECRFKVILETLCKKAGVNFHYVDTLKSGRLDIGKVQEKTKELSGTSIWYCGPTMFCDYLKNTLKKNNLNIKIHYDNFDMR